MMIGEESSRVEMKRERKRESKKGCPSVYIFTSFLNQLSTLYHLVPNSAPVRLVGRVGALIITGPGREDGFNARSFLSLIVDIWGGCVI